METVQQVQKRMLISLSTISKEMNLNEGDYVRIESKDDGSIVITPVGWHTKSQEYFWTEEWQQKLQSSKEDMDEGRFKEFNDIAELMKELGGPDA